MTRKNDILVPEGYFGNLQERLSAIPAQHAVAEAPRGVRRLMPYAAIAASMLLAVTVGNWILRRTAVRDVQGDYDSMLIAEVLGTSQIDYDREEDESADFLTDDDIVEYLIATGTTVELLDYVNDEENL